MPAPQDTDQRLSALEAAVASSASTAKLGVMVSIAFLGFTVFEWYTRSRPEPPVYIDADAI